MGWWWGGGGAESAEKCPHDSFLTMYDQDTESILILKDTQGHTPSR